MTDRMDTCATCRFFHWSTATSVTTSYGECRRRAPVIMDRGYDHAHQGRVHESTTEWPMVTGEHWCGEYEAKR